MTHIVDSNGFWLDLEYYPQEVSIRECNSVGALLNGERGNLTYHYDLRIPLEVLFSRSNGNGRLNNSGELDGCCISKAGLDFSNNRSSSQRRSRVMKSSLLDIFIDLKYSYKSTTAKLWQKMPNLFVAYNSGGDVLLGLFYESILLKAGIECVDLCIKNIKSVSFENLSFVLSMLREVYHVPHYNKNCISLCYLHNYKQVDLTYLQHCKKVYEHCSSVSVLLYEKCL